MTCFRIGFFGVFLMHTTEELDSFTRLRFWVGNSMANLSRQQIAQRMGVSVRTVARREAAWGLAQVKVRLGPRLIRYPAGKVQAILRRRGLDTK